MLVDRETQHDEVTQDVTDFILRALTDAEETDASKVINVAFHYDEQIIVLTKDRRHFQIRLVEKI